MSDYTALLDTISQSQSQKEVTANSALLAAWPAMMFGRRDSTSTGLTWGYYGGRMNGTSVANGTLSLTASNTNYVVVNRTTLAVSVSTATTNWNDTANYGRAYQVTVGASAPTDWLDKRADTGGIFVLQGLPPTGSAGGGLTGSYPNPTLVAAGSTTQIQYNSSNAFAGDSRLTFDATNKVAKGQFTVDSGGINAQTGTTYTLGASDNGKVITLSNASPITVTVPSGLGAGFTCLCIQIGAGQVTFATSSTTINPSTTLKIAAQHGAASLIAYVADTFNLSGNISA